MARTLLALVWIGGLVGGCSVEDPSDSLDLGSSWQAITAQDESSLSYTGTVYFEQENHIAVVVPEDATGVAVRMTSLLAQDVGGNADLFTTTDGSVPSLDHFACRPGRGGSNEECYHDAVSELGIMVRGQAAPGPVNVSGRSDYNINVIFYGIGTSPGLVLP
jgi:hypothetical protein